MLAGARCVHHEVGGNCSADSTGRVRQRVPALNARCGVEELLGEDLVVPSDFAVVTRCVGRDPLLPSRKHCLGEDLGSVAGSVVGDDPFDHVDAVLGAPSHGLLKESGCSRSPPTVNGAFQWIVRSTRVTPE